MGDIHHQSISILLVGLWMVTLLCNILRNLRHKNKNKNIYNHQIVDWSYGGFQKWGYPQMIHFRFGFSCMKHTFKGSPIYGNPIDVANQNHQNHAPGQVSRPPCRRPFFFPACFGDLWQWYVVMLWIFIRFRVRCMVRCIYMIKICNYIYMLDVCNIHLTYIYNCM